jgi:hypothetical protein
MLWRPLLGIVGAAALMGAGWLIATISWRLLGDYWTAIYGTRGVSRQRGLVSAVAHASTPGRYAAISACCGVAMVGIGGAMWAWSATPMFS